MPVADHRAFCNRHTLQRLLLCIALSMPIGSVAQSKDAVPAHAGTTISLNGEWKAGLNRNYTQTLTVPGLAGDPALASAGTLWYKRTVQLPAGDWQQAELTLNGARFAPEVYVNGEKVSASGGGMAPTVHLLRSKDVAPGRSIELEIALQSLNALDPQDASVVPQPDRWRSDNSSGLWDTVNLHFSSGARFTRVTPFTNYDADTLDVHWDASGEKAAGASVEAVIVDEKGNEVARSDAVAAPEMHGVVHLALHHAVHAWSPDHPAVYTLRVTLSANSGMEDVHESTWGLKSFTTQDKRFYLNGEPIQMRGGTVVWHRFLRNPEAQKIAFDPEWFRQNIVLRLRSYGANTLRFHLGLPPESFLDLCDENGLMVQLEWPFFHGIKASDASMREQWHEWLDVAMRHPSVMIVHPWNETDGDELKAGWAAMNAVLADYPPLVVAHRDTLHIHKYWWSIFENLGLYYDSADQFDQTIMVDEFGGNYLDQEGDAALYPAVKETFLRFLGRVQTRQSRLEFHAESNARVGEYWRRIGAAGILPFCILGSPQDGASWFLGHMQNPQPMPVWDALAALWSPQSVSLNVWDRNYAPSQQVTLPVFFFNDTSAPATLMADVQILSTGRNAHAVLTKTVTSLVPAHGQTTVPVVVKLPDAVGNWEFAATLKTTVAGVTHPIVSSWQVRTLRPAAPAALAGISVGVPENETELRTFLQQNGIRSVRVDDPKAKIILTSEKTWANIGASRSMLAAAVERGASVVLLDIGLRDLGQGYRKGDLGPLDGAPRLKPGEATTQSQDLFAGIKVNFEQVAEPESHIQPGADDDSLWQNLPRPATWLWNGLRGGLIAPAADMEVTGLSSKGFVAQWTGHGADAKSIVAGGYYAYQLAGYYAFSHKANDKQTMADLRNRVKFLAEDAPALQDALNPNSPIEQTDLGKGYRSAGGQAQRLIQLSTCGKSLTRTDIIELTFGDAKGNVILSQALTAGRLVRGYAEPGQYGIRYDPAAEQFVLNILAKSIAPDTQPAARP